MDTWRNGCLREMDDLPVYTTSNHNPPKMDVRPKLFFKLSLLLNGQCGNSVWETAAIIFAFSTVYCTVNPSSMAYNKYYLALIHLPVPLQLTVRCRYIGTAYCEVQVQYIGTADSKYYIALIHLPVPLQLRMRCRYIGTAYSEEQVHRYS